MENKLKEHIIPHNANVYMRIATDMFDKKEGVFTFIIKTDGKKIVDYVRLESVSPFEKK